MPTFELLCLIVAAIIWIVLLASFDADPTAD
jgi:hypothetical protein